MVMNNNSLDRRALRPSATLLLVGQLLYVVVTLLHTGGEANNHPAIFAAYASSAAWTAVHVAQFACMAIMIAGLLGLFSALDGLAGAAGLANRFGIASATAALALYGAVLAVDGVALKQAVNAWMSALEAEKAARFASAETMRWLEWGTRSYENFTLGLAVLMAAAVVRKAPLPQPMTYVMGLSALTYLVAAEVLNAVWMTWLLIVAWRMPESASTSLRR
jgi:hypothetical protein